MLLAFASVSNGRTLMKIKPSRVPTLLISMDGFRADKLDEFLKENPNSCWQREFVEKGVKADYMNPSFPTLTFPNHYTLVTGKNIDKHDIVGNTVYDPDYKKKISLIGDRDKLNVEWWNSSDPIWLTAKDQGLKTSSFFWVGSEVWTRHPDVFLAYTNTYTFDQRVNEVVNWFQKLKMDFSTLYFNEPDHTGHTYGPQSPEYKAKIVEMDGVINDLITRLRSIGLLDQMNIVIVSDHGMTDMGEDNTLIVSKYVDTNLIDSSKTVYGIVGSIHPKNDSVKVQVYNSLKKIPNLRTYYKEEVPAELHYRLSKRIGPIVTIADEGYVLNTVKQTLSGNHGFDPNVEAMRTIFMARGPDFKPNSRVAPFRNVDIHPLLCKLIDIECPKGDGTSETFDAVLNRESTPDVVNINFNIIG